MAFNLNGCNFNSRSSMAKAAWINTWADVLNRAGLGMEVGWHERTRSQTSPLDLAFCRSPPLVVDHAFSIG